MLSKNLRGNEVVIISHRVRSLLLSSKIALVDIRPARSIGDSGLS